MEVEFKISGGRQAAARGARELREALRVAGIDVEFKEALTKSGYDVLRISFDEHALAMRCGRNAGAPRKPVPEGSVLEGMDDVERARWTAKAEISEICEAWGVSQSTAYHRKREALDVVGMLILGM